MVAIILGWFIFSTIIGPHIASQDFTTSKVGKAIQIQSIGEDANHKLVVFVQNVGDSAVVLTPNQCVYVNGVLDDSATVDLTTLNRGDTATITTTFGVSVNTPYVVRVLTETGTFTEATKTFS